MRHHQFEGQRRALIFAAGGQHEMAFIDDAPLPPFVPDRDAAGGVAVLPVGGHGDDRGEARGHAIDIRHVPARPGKAIVQPARLAHIELGRPAGRVGGMAIGVAAAHQAPVAHIALQPGGNAGIAAMGHGVEPAANIIFMRLPYAFARIIVGRRIGAVEADRVERHGAAIVDVIDARRDLVRLHQIAGEMPVAAIDLASAPAPVEIAKQQFIVGLAIAIGRGGRQVEPQFWPIGHGQAEAIGLHAIVGSADRPVRGGIDAGDQAARRLVDERVDRQDIVLLRRIGPGQQLIA